MRFALPIFYIIFDCITAFCIVVFGLWLRNEVMKSGIALPRPLRQVLDRIAVIMMIMGIVYVARVLTRIVFVSLQTEYGKENTLDVLRHLITTPIEILPILANITIFTLISKPQSHDLARRYNSLRRSIFRSRTDRTAMESDERASVRMFDGDMEMNEDQIVEQLLLNPEFAGSTALDDMNVDYEAYDTALTKF